jgi:hypothetical protein
MGREIESRYDIGWQLFKLKKEISCRGTVVNASSYNVAMLLFET